jgi:hypothetical protein
VLFNTGLDRDLVLAGARTFSFCEEVGQ